MSKKKKNPSLMSCTEEPSQALAGVAVGQPRLFLFKEDLDHGVLSGGGGVRSSGSSNWKGQGVQQ